MERLAAWWDRFATTEVSDVRRVHGGEAAASAGHVAEALARWHERGEASADLAFWRDTGELPLAQGVRPGRRCPAAQGRLPGGHGLLISWLGQAEQVPLEDGESLVPRLALWICAGCSGLRAAAAGRTPWLLMRSSSTTWRPTPRTTGRCPRWSGEPRRAGRNDEDDLYGAAYEGVTYQDTTDDDEEAPSRTAGRSRASSTSKGTPRLEKRLRSWRRWPGCGTSPPGRAGKPVAQLTTWLTAARQQSAASARVARLLPCSRCRSRRAGTMPSSSTTAGRDLKEHLLNRTIDTCLGTYLAVSTLQGVLGDNA